MFHLHQTCPHDQTLHYPPYNQTLHYHFQKNPNPLGKSVQSIIYLQSNSTDYILSFQNIYLRLVLTIRLCANPIKSDSTLSFSKISHPPRQVHKINHSAAI